MRNKYKLWVGFSLGLFGLTFLVIYSFLNLPTLIHCLMLLPYFVIIISHTYMGVELLKAKGYNTKFSFANKINGEEEIQINDDNLLTKVGDNVFSRFADKNSSRVEVEREIAREVRNQNNNEFSVSQIMIIMEKQFPDLINKDNKSEVFREIKKWIENDSLCKKTRKAEMTQYYTFI